MELNFSEDLKVKLDAFAIQFNLTLDELITEIVNCFKKINSEIEITEDNIKFNNKFEKLELKTYLGVLSENEKIIAYVALVPPSVGARNGFISQQIFTGANKVIEGNLSSNYIDLFNKPVYLLDICRDSFPSSSALNSHIVKKLGFFYESYHHENGEEKLIDEGLKLVSNIHDFDNLIKATSQSKTDNDYFDLDDTARVLYLKSKRLKSENALTNQPYWYVMKTYLAVQLAYQEGYIIDKSELNRDITTNKTIDIFKLYVDKLNSLKPKYKQLLLYGAPGTGKSFEVDKIIIKSLNLTYKEDLNKLENIFRITVYPDYGYGDFIGSIMPTMVKDIHGNTNIGYDFICGTLTKSLVYAFTNPTVSTFLVIEEMSRGDIAGIFGDIFQLLDRDKFGNSEYSVNNEFISTEIKKAGLPIDKIFFPKNFSIMGTVNTSDQNVYVIDTAFTRRFDYRYINVKPVKDINGSLLNEYKFTLEDIEFEWNKLYMAINEFIITELGLNEDKQIGQFFIKFDNYYEDFEKFNAIQNKLIHYLWDDVQNVAVNEGSSLFKGYNSFSLLYDDFGNKKNIFSEKFMSIYKKTTVTS